MGQPPFNNAEDGPAAVRSPGHRIHTMPELIGEAHALAAANKKRALSLLIALVRQPTYEPAQCADIFPLVRSTMADLGFDIEEHGPKNSSGNTLPVIIGWLGPRSLQPDVLLCAHADTSPAGEGWTRQAFDAERDGGMVFGRGAACSKSDVSVFIHAALSAFVPLSHRHQPSIAVAITCDEGSGGDLGAAFILNGLGIRPALAVFPGVTDVVTVAHSGCVQLKVRITGAACHQSLLPMQEDAMRRVAAICSAIYAHANALSEHGSASAGVGNPTLSITRIVGGDEFGMAPREVEIWIDRRTTPDENLIEARDEIISIVGAASDALETDLDYEVVRMAEPMRPSPKQRRFTALLCEEARAAVGTSLTTGCSSLYTDARWFSNAGIPTLMYGAGESDIRVSGANGADERVPEQCLDVATILIARAIVRFIAGEREP